MNGSETYFERRVKKINDEIASTRKYPKSFQYLPADYQNSSDNANIMKLDKNPLFCDGPGLSVQPHLLGRNKKSRMEGQQIAFGEIYIIHAKGTDLYKIGISSNFNRRFRDLCAASPLPIIVVKYARCDNPHLLENEIHDLFSHKYFKNEWFELTTDELLYCFSKIDKYFNL